MEKIELVMTNSTPFALLSQEFPDLIIYRWCTSIIDYVEMYGTKERVAEAEIRLKETVNKIHSFILSTDSIEDRTSAAISCRCNSINSTIRLAESMNLLWEAPAIYRGGEEILRLISFSEHELMAFFYRVSKIGQVRVAKKKKIKPDSLRDVYSISLKELFGDMSTKQAMFLRDAIAKGMFSSPKKMKLEDLAKVHRISKSTMQEHLIKARNKLIHSIEPYLTLYISSEVK